MLKNPVIDSIRALMPSATTVAGALVSGALMEAGSQFVKGGDVKDSVGNVLGFAKDVGLELLGQKPLPSIASAASCVDANCRCKCNGGSEPCVCGPECNCTCQHQPGLSGVPEDAAATAAAGAVAPAAGASKKVPLAPRPGLRVGGATVGGAPAVGAWRGGYHPHEWAARYGERFWEHPEWRAAYEQPLMTPQDAAVDVDSTGDPRMRHGHHDRILVSGTPEHAQIPGAAPAKPTAAPATAAPAVPAVGAAPSVRTMCTCAIYAGTPVLAGPGERIEFKQCDVCKKTALETTKYNLGMALGWADAWRNATGVDPMGLGEACGARPDPNAVSYRGSFGFNDRQYNVDLAGWQRCAASTASAQAKAKMGSVGQASAPAKPAVPAAQPVASHAASVAPTAAPAAAPAAASAAPVAVTPSDVAAMKVAQVGRRSDKKLDALHAELAKTSDPAQQAALKREADLAAEKKHHAETVANHLQSSPENDEHKAVHAKLVAAIHEHADKGPEVMESMLASLFAMLPRSMSFQQPPWGGPAPVDASQVFNLDPLDPSASMDFPLSDDGSDLSSLPELSVQGATPVEDASAAAQVRPPAPTTPAVQAPPAAASLMVASLAAPAAPLASAPTIDGAMEAPPVGFSMDPSDSDSEFGGVDESVLEGLGDDERDLVVGYAKQGYSDDDVREYAAMYRAAAGNQHEHPGVCDQGCSLSRDRRP